MNESVYFDILQAVRVAILAIIPPTMTPDQVRVRKRPAYFKDQDALPFICISPEAEDVVEEKFGGNCFVHYPIQVTLLTESKLSLEELAWQLARRQGIRRKLHRALLAGADTVFDCVRYEPSPVFDVGGLDQLFDVSMQRFTFASDEAREEG